MKKLLKPLKKSSLRKQGSHDIHWIPAFAGMTYSKWHFFGVFLLLVLLAACTGMRGVPFGKMAGIYPGMSCDNLETYLKEAGVPFEKPDSSYRFRFKDGVWDSAQVACSGTVAGIEISSLSGKAPKYSKMYNEVHDALMRTFMDNGLFYREGERIIDFGNGISLQQFVDTKAGLITHFKVIVREKEGVQDAWKKAADILISPGA